MLKLAVYKITLILVILFYLTGCEDSPTVTLKATPESVSENGSTSLNWSSTGVTSCRAEGDWSGSKDTSGTETIGPLITDSTFTLSCTGNKGSAGASVKVMVGMASATTVSLSAAPTTVSPNGSTTLNWDSSNAVSCTASGDWSGNKDTSGTETITSLTSDSQFTLNCSNANGSVSDTVDVTIVATGNGTALLSWTPPTQNTDGSTLTNLAGYRIYYGTASGSYTHTVTIENPGLTSYQIDNLRPADWYFVITSFNSSSMESTYSNEVSKTIN